MATKVHMEALSPTMEEGQLVRWLKKEGDAVSEGDVLAEIETDKATMELVARGSGVLQNITLKEGATAPVGQVIAVIGSAEGAEGAEGAEDAASDEKPAKTANAAKETKQSADETAEKSGEDESAEEEESEAKPERAAAAVKTEPKAKPARESAQPSNGDGRVKASPLARRLASESGVELSGVEGSGPGGRIVKADIEATLKQGGSAARGGAQHAGAETEEIPVTQMRKAIAKRLAQSIGPVPTFYLTIEVDMTRMMQARERVNEQLAKRDVKASVNDLLIKALAVALSKHPEVNASWGESAITRHHRVHIGVAVAIDEGLITPIVRDAHLKGVADIAAEVKELAGRAREKKLKPEEYTGATFSISNLGMFGIDEFTAIINPPEAGILAVGAVQERVVVENGEIIVQPRMRMTMSCDHRVIDGAMGAKFLQTLRGMIEEPVMMVV